MLNDAHVHFFSPGFFDALGAQLKLPQEGRAAEVVKRAGWDDPGTSEALADRWAAELDRHGVGRAAIIASLPGDETSVAAALGRHPSRFVGFFMLNPTAEDALDRVRRALDAGLRGICLFPAMHGYPLGDERVARVFALAASRDARLFVHCGMLSVGVRKKLGLPSPFDLRLGHPLDLLELARRHPSLPIIVPRFGAGFLREALMLGDACSNVRFDTSSSNAWIRYTPGLTLAGVFRSALDVVGPDRLLFGTDSSYFPRGWTRDVYERQLKALEEAAVPPDARAKILGGNFARLFTP